MFLAMKMFFFENKTFNQHFGTNLKENIFLLKFVANFLLFLSFLGFRHEEC